MEARVVSAITRLEAYMRTTDDAMAIPRDAGEFVHALLTATGARRGVEIGTSYGYSALWAASAIAHQGGRLVTIDHDPKKHAAAAKVFEDAGLANVIECVTGKAREVLAQVDGPIDYVLNDADKRNCIVYVEQLIERLAPRAVVLTDNTLTHPRELARFKEWIRRHPRFTSAHVPVGNGMELSVFLGSTDRDAIS